MTKKRPEVLAPVGNWAMFEAALAAGADVIYAASKSFGARAFASNFSNDELSSLIKRAHWNGVKVYITFNTLVKEEELDEAIQQIDALIEMNCDALIVQDMGIIRLLKSRYPDFPIHGSTQLSVTSLEGALALEDLGLKRVVLGREVSIEEAKRIKETTSLEVEAFVHGSLCVSVSGQCLMSSFAGGRSGNRGRCAQPCRKTYELKNGQGKLIGKENTYISPRDLQTISFIHFYQEIGLDCFKIEGRMKKPEYVFTAVSSYRQALDERSVDLLALQMVSNRPFTKGLPFHDFGPAYAFGQDEKAGALVGRVKRSGPAFVLPLALPIKKGDIIQVRSKKHYFPLTATEDLALGTSWDLSLYQDLLEGEEAYLIYRQASRDTLEERLDFGVDRKRPIELSLTFTVGHPLQMSATSEGLSVGIEGDLVQQARTQPLSKDRLEDAILQFGQSPFYSTGIQIQVEGDGFLPISALKQARRKLLADLEKSLIDRDYPPYKGSTRSPQISVNKPHPQSLNWSLQNMQIELDTYDLPEVFGRSIDHLAYVIVHREEQIDPWLVLGIPVYYAGPRLLEEAGYHKLREVIQANQDKLSGFLIQSLNDLGFYQRLLEEGLLDLSRVKLMGGHELNITNHESIQWIAEAGLGHYVISPELGIEDIVMMEKAANVESTSHLLAYGRLSGMLMKHCPASLIKGCLDDAQCPSCSFRKNIYLEDEFGSREVYRQHGYSELLLPDVIDLRYDPSIVKKARPDYIHLIHRGEEEIEEVVNTWAMWITSDGSNPIGPPVKKGKRNLLGNYINGIE